MLKKINNKEYWDTLIIDLLSENISEENRQKVEQWKEASTQNLQYFNQMKELWNSATVADPNLSFDYKKAYSLFIKRATEIKKTAVAKKERSISWHKISIVAAVIIPFILLSYYSYFQQIPAGNTKLIVTEINSPKGSKTQLKLADGTIVWLNSGSQIIYNDRFGKENRHLELIGEAYLNVAHNEQIPLILKARGVNIKVLGTKFNINAYPDTDDIKVSLFEGSVSMNINNTINSTILKPMQTGIYQTINQKISVKQGISNNTLRWMKNELIFSGETFAEIAHILERHFDVKISVKNKGLKERCFGGDFKNGESIDKILKIMAINGNFKYKINNKKIEIY